MMMIEGPGHAEVPSTSSTLQVRVTLERGRC